jgi:hypothetical protein
LRDLRLIPDYPEIDFYRRRGTAVHLATSLFDQGHLADVDDRLLGYLEAWKAWLKVSGFKASLIEHQVWSQTYLYAGTLDRYGTLDGKTALVDIKSGQIAGYAALQLAAYKRALEERTGVLVQRRVAVQLSSDGKFKVKEYTDHASDDRMFLLALSVWQWRERNT